MPPRLVESPLRWGVRWKTWGCASAVVARRAKAVWMKNFMLSEGLVIGLGKSNLELTKVKESAARPGKNWNGVSNTS